MPAYSRVESKQLATINALTVAPELRLRRNNVSPGLMMCATQSPGTTPHFGTTATAVSAGSFSTTVGVAVGGLSVDVAEGKGNVGGIDVAVAVTSSSATATGCVGRGGGTRICSPSATARSNARTTVAITPRANRKFVRQEVAGCHCPCTKAPLPHYAHYWIGAVIRRTYCQRPFHSLPTRDLRAHL